MEPSLNGFSLSLTQLESPLDILESFFQTHIHDFRVIVIRDFLWIQLLTDCLPGDSEEETPDVIG